MQECGLAKNSSMGIFISLDVCCPEIPSVAVKLNIVLMEKLVISYTFSTIEIWLSRYHRKHVGPSLALWLPVG